MPQLSHVRACSSRRTARTPRQVGDDVAHLQFDLVDQVVALEAVPLELLEGALAAHALDDQSDRTRGGARGECGRLPGSSQVSPSRMCTRCGPSSVITSTWMSPSICRTTPRTGRGGSRCAGGSADDLHDEVVAQRHRLVVDRRREQVPILGDPLLEVDDGRDDGHERSSESAVWVRRWAGTYATPWISMSRCGCGSWCTATVVRGDRSRRTARRTPRCIRRSRSSTRDTT